MPSKNALKTYVEGGYYHIYNRGVEKRRIFFDRGDYNTFLHYLSLYLTPIDEIRKEKPLLRLNIVKNNLSDEVELLAYCLMPNHFHLLVKQKAIDGITRLMRQITTGYSMYFNKRYNRQGHLFQGRFKAANIDSDEHLLHLSRYIHLNPKDRGVSLTEFEWSSYLNYLGNKNEQWVNTGLILNYFTKGNYQGTYKQFVEEYKGETPILASDLFLETD